MRIKLAIVASFLFAFSARIALAQPCESGECQENGMCTALGVCMGTPISGGTCDDFNPCTTNDTCMNNGLCGGTPRPNGSPCGDAACGGTCLSLAGFSICMPEEEDRPCTDQFGDCTTNDRCQPFIGCLGDLVECPDVDSDPCTLEFCNAESGQCQVVGSKCGECQTCNPESGECEAGASSPTPTRTGGVSTPTPTPTATGAQVTATSTATPTTPTTPTSTATPPPPGECVADCDDNEIVTVAELIRAVHIALGILPLQDCDDADPDGDGTVTVVDLIDATRASLASSCI